MTTAGGQTAAGASGGTASDTGAAAQTGVTGAATTGAGGGQPADPQDPGPKSDVLTAEPDRTPAKSAPEDDGKSLEEKSPEPARSTPRRASGTTAPEPYLWCLNKGTKTAHLFVSGTYKTLCGQDNSSMPRLGTDSREYDQCGSCEKAAG